MAISIEEWNKLKDEHNSSTGKRNISFEEYNIQSSFFIWVGHLFPELDKKIFHISNEGKRNKKYVKKSGIKKGVADVFLSKPNKDYHGLYIEFKTQDGKQSEEQIEFQKQVESEKYKYIICRTAGDAIEEVKKYLNN